MKDRINVKIKVNDDYIEINDDNTEISFFSKGNGGQNLNKHEKGVKLKYKIPKNKFKKNKFIMTSCINQRSLEQNLKKAIEQLIEKIRKHFYKKPERKDSKIPKREKRKRLNEKKVNSQKKESRRKTEYLD